MFGRRSSSGRLASVVPIRVTEAEKGFLDD
jgi:hypothetical protein